jgi:hypothetical protein
VIPHKQSPLNAISRGFIAFLVAVLCFVGPACASIRTTQADCCGGGSGEQGQFQLFQASHQAPCCAIKDKAAVVAIAQAQPVLINNIEPVTFVSPQLGWFRPDIDVLAEEKAVFAKSFILNERDRYLRLRVLLN